MAGDQSSAYALNTPACGLCRSASAEPMAVPMMLGWGDAPSAGRSLGVGLLTFGTDQVKANGKKTHFFGTGCFDPAGWPVAEPP